MNLKQLLVSVLLIVFPSQQHTARLKVFNVTTVLRQKRELQNDRNGKMPEHFCPYTFQDSTNLLNTISQVVQSFYQKNLQVITVSDGGVGLGVLRGQLNYVLGQREDKLSPKVKARFQLLHSISSKLAFRILNQSIEAATDAKLKHGLKVLKRNPNILQARFRNWLNTSRIEKHFDEFQKVEDVKSIESPFHDFHCFASLVEDCNIPKPCEETYLSEIRSGHMLMHQVMFQQFAERRACIPVNKDAFGDAQAYKDRLCSKAYLEAKYHESRNFSNETIGLFAEQVGLCGLIGYPNFMRPDWLQKILSWNLYSRSGCFLEDVLNAQKTNDTILSDTNEWCSIHKTSVYLMALSVNLRYMIDTCTPNIFDGYSY